MHAREFGLCSTDCVPNRCVEDKSDNQAVQSLQVSVGHRVLSFIAYNDFTVHLSAGIQGGMVKLYSRENENEDHRDEHPRLIDVCSDTLHVS